MKVAYTLSKGDYSGNKRRSTAYLEHEVEQDLWVGVNKHTDEPVKIKWTGEEWVECE